MEKYVMALDQGTTSSRCILYDKKGNAISTAQKEFTQIYPYPGWVEHDAMEIWSTQIGVAQEAMLKANATYENIAAIGITNQRETTVVWDRKTGEPICNAIVWQCRRTAKYCKELEEKGYSEFFKNKTGLLIDAYFSATKLKWILDNIPNAREKANNGELAFGTIETWLIFKLSGGKLHVTDYSNASRTMMFNIYELCWDKEILELLEIPEAMLPEVKPSSYIYGETSSKVFGGGIKIAGAAGDQQAALFGQTCFSPGEAKNTYGTGCFLLMNTGEKPVTSQHGLITTIAWGVGDKINYALEGSVFVAGAAIQWLRDEMKILDSASQSEKFAELAGSSDGIYVVPAFVGLGAPYWNPNARGTIFGLTRGSNKFQLVRATLESLAYQTCDLVSAMEQDSEIKLKVLRVDGGASANNFLMQFQCDMLGENVARPKCIETTSLGAAYLAGLAVGYWKSKEEVLDNWQIEKAFKPSMSIDEKNRRLKNWKNAVRCAISFSEE